MASSQISLGLSLLNNHIAMPLTAGKLRSPWYDFNGQYSSRAPVLYNLRMPMTAALAGDNAFPGGFPGDHHHASVFDTALRNDVVGKMLHLGTGAAQRGHFHAVVTVEMDMQRSERHVM